MLAVSIALALGGGVRDAGAAFPGANGRIVYASDRDAGTAGPAELFAIDPDGTDRVQLTTTPGDESNPAWSADGAKIAFDRDGDLFVINADGSGETNVTSSPASFDVEPAWSPDGTRLVFRRFNELFAIDVDGTDEDQLTDYPEFFNTSDSQPAWSPDGTKIAFATTRDELLGRAEIYVMNADGTGQTQLTTNPGFDDVAPNWSPDGTKIVWQRENTAGSNQDDIFVMNADGSGQTSVTSGNARDAGPVWSPDGTKIVFQSEDFLWTVNPDGTGLTQLTSGVVPTETSDREPDWGAVAVPSRTLTVSKAGSGSGTVTSAPAGISCGGDCSQDYTDGTSVTLTAAAASGSTFTSWSGCNSVAGTQCTVGMTGGRSVTATFGAQPSPPPEPTPTEPPSAPPAGVDLRLTLSSAGAQVGGTAIVTAHVVNAGSATATAVRLEGFLPAQAFAVTPSAGTCDLAAGRLDCALGTLAPGGSAGVTISLFSESAAQVHLALSVGSGSPELQPGDNAAQTVVEFQAVPALPTADLAVEITGPDSGLANTVVTFTGRIVNVGPAEAASVSLRGAASYGLRLLTAIPQRGSCTIGVDAYCEIGVLAPGEAVSFVLTARLSRKRSLDARAELAVTAAGAVADSLPTNDRAVAAVRALGGVVCDGVERCVTLTTRMTADVTAAAVGERVSFRTTVSIDVAGWPTPSGPDPFAPSGPVPFTLLDEMPVGVELISASSSTGACATTATVISCVLDPRMSQPLWVDVVVLVREPGTIVNRAAVVSFDSLNPVSVLRAEHVVAGCGVVGTDGPDVLRGRFAGDRVCALGGADDVTMPGGGFVRGDGGADVITAGGSVEAEGGEGDDTLLGSDADDVLNGGEGADRLEGRGGADVLAGGPGNDVLLPGPGRSSVGGGAGNDFIHVTELVGPTSASGGAGEDMLVGRSNAALLGGDGADLLVDVGGGVNLILSGEGGADRIMGGTTAWGGPGDDTLIGDGRSQVMSGHGGNDTLDGRAGADVIDAGAGDDVVDGDGTATKGSLAPVGNDTIVGGAGRDVLRGGLGRDTIHGDAGNDDLDGGGGADTLGGGDGDDAIEGGPLADLLEGDAGNDRLEGGGASDHVFGGPGDDHVRGNDGLDRLVGGSGRDTILPGNQADVVDAIDGERDILQCAQEPAVVDGPFLADEVDFSPYCRSLVYDFRLAGWNLQDWGYCIFSATRTIATLVYAVRTSAVGGWAKSHTVTMHGSPGDLDRHRIHQGTGYSSYAQHLEVTLVAQREGLTATHVNLYTISGFWHGDPGCN